MIQKYRCWDKKNKKMYNDICFVSSGEKDDDWICFLEREKLKSIKDKIIFDNPFIRKQIVIQQFTGLLDKRGKEIYEGDICQYIDDGAKKMGEVRFDQGRFEIGQHNGYGGIWDGLEILLGEYWENKEAQNSFEIIGNTFENPELLRGVENE